MKKMTTRRFALIYTRRLCKHRRPCDACRRYIERGEIYLEGQEGGSGVQGKVYPWRYHVDCVSSKYQRGEK